MDTFNTYNYFYCFRNMEKLKMNKQIAKRIMDALIKDVHYEKTYPAHTAYYQLDFKKAEQLLEKEISSLFKAQQTEIMKIEKLIAEEILICHKENQPTSRLTSLAVKIKTQCKKFVNK